MYASWQLKQSMFEAVRTLSVFPQSSTPNTRKSVSIYLCKNANSYTQLKSTRRNIKKNKWKQELMNRLMIEIF